MERESRTMSDNNKHFIHVNMQGEYRTFQGTARILNIKPHQLHAIMERHDDFPKKNLSGYRRTYYDPAEVKKFLEDKHYISSK